MDRYGPGTPYNLNFSIGGQIGIDCAPCGWDKTFCIQFLPEAQFPEIHFFGDKTQPGGGDYELYEHSRTVGHAVTSPEHTLQLVEELFLTPAAAVSKAPPLRIGILGYAGITVKFCISVRESGTATVCSRPPRATTLAASGSRTTCHTAS